MGLLWAPHWSYQGWGSCQICRSGCRGCCQADLLTAPDVTGVWCWATFDGVFVLRFDHFQHSLFASLCQCSNRSGLLCTFTVRVLLLLCLNFLFVRLHIVPFHFHFLWRVGLQFLIDFTVVKREMQEWILVPSGAYQSLTRFWWATLACSSSGTCPFLALTIGRRPQPARPSPARLNPHNTTQLHHLILPCAACSTEPKVAYKTIPPVCLILGHLVSFPPFWKELPGIFCPTKKIIILSL